MILLALVVLLACGVALAQTPQPALLQPELTVTAHSWGIISPTGELVVLFTDRDSNPASSDRFQGPSLSMSGGVIRGIVDIEGGRGTASSRTSNLNIGAGNGTNHRGVLALNPDIGSEIRLMNGHGHACVKVLTDRTVMLDCAGHRLMQFGPGRHITFFVRPRWR